MRLAKSAARNESTLKVFSEKPGGEQKDGGVAEEHEQEA